MQHPVALVTQAVTEAVARGAYQVEAVEQVLLGWLKPVPDAVPLDPERYPEYATLQLAPVSLAGYDRLLLSQPVVARTTGEVAA
ncbi:MAG TPA: hypothetical protein VLA19_02765 [Herpetosiphonaceae bacterium]|nr:hypothetical protein [Herpetosiphonaceae bacterium]